MKNRTSKKRVVVSFKKLPKEIQEIIKQIRRYRKGRGAWEILMAANFVAEPGPGVLPLLLGRKVFTKPIKELHKNLAERIQKETFISPKITEEFPVLSVDSRGNLVFRKLTKAEKIKMKLAIGRHKVTIPKLSGKTDFTQEFLERIKREAGKRKRRHKRFY
jgi:hypothetical protein